MVSPCVCTLTPPLQLVQLGRQRTEYVTPGPVAWRDRLVGSSPFSPYLGFSLIDTPRQYAAGRTAHVAWASGPLVPGVATPAQASRNGDSMSFSLPSGTDSVPDHSGAFGDVTGRLLRDGEVVRTFDFGVFGSVPVPAGDAGYRLEVATRRAPHSAWATTLSSDTAWTFRSETTAAATPLQLLDLDYRLGLDELSAVRAGRSQQLDFGARLVGAAKPVRLGAFDVAVSYDDSETWRDAHAVFRDGEAWAHIVHPKLSKTNGFVGLRVSARDARSGATVEQTTLRAFRLR
jgi:hypothetical protein